MENLQKVNKALDRLDARLSVLLESSEKTVQIYEDIFELAKRRMRVSGE